MSDLVVNILANITGFITYFAPGYIFLGCYNYVSCTMREIEKEYLVLKCVSISYLFYVLSSFFGSLHNLDNIAIQAITFLSAMFFGLLFGRIHRTQFANKISLFCFKREMTNNLFVELWEKATDKNCVVLVTFTMKNNIGIYEGQIYKVLSYNTNPNIILSYYICYDNEMKILCDYTDDDNSLIIVNYSDIQRAEYELVPIN